ESLTLGYFFTYFCINRFFIIRQVIFIRECRAVGWHRSLGRLSLAPKDIFFSSGGGDQPCPSLMVAASVRPFGAGF
ncbi:hypothetical protein, partial [Gloeomargarita lithophora]|uniref:hypothetical protein n=1 Tax=Gloeomargarita lithophora TaxID=1188228 RepID=UPI001C12B441